MNSRRGSTLSPKSTRNMSSAAAASRMLTCKSVRFDGSSVVSRSSSAFRSDELAAWLDLVSQEHAEHVVRGGRVAHADLQERAVRRIERRVAELFRVPI